MAFIARDTTAPSGTIARVRVFVITGPSGVGKGTLIRALRERVSELALAVSATTRDPRPGEEDGRDYHFLSDDEFERRVQAGEFVRPPRCPGPRHRTLRPEPPRYHPPGRPARL